MPTHSFSLSYLPDRAFPCAVSVAGTVYPINPTVRDILRLLRLMQDTTLLDAHKALIARSIFYPGDSPPDPLSGFEAFMAACPGAPRAAEADEGPQEKQFDYEFDAAEIYASFAPPHGSLTLAELQALHWYDFTIRLMNLPEESPFCQKIRMRFFDLSGLKGKALMDATRAKAQAQLPEELTREDAEAQAEFEKEWGG